MNPDDDAATRRRAMVADLHRLIEALDKRVPRLDRSDEAQIALDAADLRERASSLLLRIDEAQRLKDQP